MWCQGEHVHKIDMKLLWPGHLGQCWLNHWFCIILFSDKVIPESGISYAEILKNQDYATVDTSELNLRQVAKFSLKPNLKKLIPHIKWMWHCVFSETNCQIWLGLAKVMTTMMSQELNQVSVQSTTFKNPLTKPRQKNCWSKKRFLINNTILCFKLLLGIQFHWNHLKFVDPGQSSVIH